MNCLPSSLPVSLSMFFMLLFFLATPARAQTPPPFNPETYPPANSYLDCDVDGDGNVDGDPLGDESPSRTDIVGDYTGGNTYWSGAAWHDNSDTGFAYFALRLDDRPSGPRIFDQYAWVALMQVPNGNLFQYQYLLNLNGIGPGGGANDVSQIWRNDPLTATNVDFSPIFNDPAETILWQADYATGGPAGAPFNGARAVYVPAASNIGGEAGETDWIIFWSIPISQLITLGIIGSHLDLDNTLFFLATSANPNNFNKDYLDCSFSPPAQLEIDKLVFPPTIEPGQTDLEYTITVTNKATSPVAAKGVVIEDYDFDTCMAFTPADVSVTVPAGRAFSKVTATSPNLKVEVNFLAPGESAVVTIQVDASGCTLTDPPTTYTNTATAFATNATEVDDNVSVGGLLPVELVAFDAVLDGRKLELYWKTASETNNAGFEVQRLYAGDDWEVLGWVNGYGTTELPQSYRYEVADLTPGRHTFRLKQVDYDGTFDYSPLIEVAVELPETYLVTDVYPNPFNPQASFSFSVRRQQQVTIGVYDMLGRRVLDLYQGTPEGNTTRTIFIDASDLTSGTYMLRVLGEHFVETQLFTVAK